MSTTTSITTLNTTLNTQKTSDGKVQRLHHIPFPNTPLAHQKWQLEHMAGAFRIFAKLGFADGASGHISLRDPIHPKTFWINPYGIHFDLLTVSDMVQVDEEGRRVGGADKPINTAGFIIHSVLHQRRPDVNAAVHLHSEYGRAWSTFGRGVDMLNQDSCMFHNDLAIYPSFGGVVFSTEEGHRISDALGPTKKNIILQNHGLLTTGGTVGEAAAFFIALERACHAQFLVESAILPGSVGGSSTGLVKSIVGDEEAEYTKKGTGSPEAIADFTFSILPATNRSETKSLLPNDIAENGPIHAFIIRMGTPPYEPFDADLLSALTPHCRIIVSASAGFNEFDVEWMAREGIWFCNTVDAVAEATADMAIFLTLAVLRNTSLAERRVREGLWRSSELVPGRDPSGLTLGIIGLGAIGKYLAKKARAFNLKITYHNRHQLPAAIETEYNLTYAPTLTHLLSTSDIISVNCPLNSQTTSLLSHAEFASMKDDVFIINTARGAVIHEEALIAALESAKVARAGLDVFPDEPNVNSYFRENDKVVLQPHLGGLTDMAYQRAETECFENVRALFRDGRPISPVIVIEEKKKKEI
ncbi:class II aldolase/adducin N-terminal [Aspergillus spectabilis]